MSVLLFTSMKFSLKKCFPPALCIGLSPSLQAPSPRRDITAFQVVFRLDPLHPDDLSRERREGWRVRVPRELVFFWEESKVICIQAFSLPVGRCSPRRFQCPVYRGRWAGAAGEEPIESGPVTLGAHTCPRGPRVLYEMMVSELCFVKPGPSQGEPRGPRVLGSLSLFHSLNFRFCKQRRFPFSVA